MTFDKSGNKIRVVAAKYLFSSACAVVVPDVKKMTFTVSATLSFDFACDVLWPPRRLLQQTLPRKDDDWDWEH